MELGKIEELMKLMQSYGFNELEVEQDDTKVKLVQNAAPSQPGLTQGYLQAQPTPQFFQNQAPVQTQSSSQTQATDSSPSENKNYKEIRSPFVGTFYESPSPGSEAFATVGQRVKRGDTLCIVEAMKLMNEIEADCDGTIVKICINNEEPVEFDQVLFLVE